MSKVTKKQLQRDIELLESGIGMNWSDMKKIETRLNHAMNEMAQQLEALEEFATYADNMLTELNHALPDPEYDAKCEAQEADVDASLDRHRERLGLNKPQLKQLDQSVFDGEPEQIKWAVVTNEGAVLKFELEPMVKDGLWVWTHSNGCRQHSLIGQYDTTNWQNSLIEREKVELTGSDLCRVMLERGDKYVLCFVSDFSDDYAANQAERINLITHTEGKSICAKSARWKYAVPINQQTGEPLTQSDVGL